MLFRSEGAKGTPVDGLALVSAIWARYCLGRTEADAEIAPNDPHWRALQQAAQKAETQPAAWLDQRQIYGDLKDAPRFADAFVAAYGQLQAGGVESAISTLLADQLVTGRVST